MSIEVSKLMSISFARAVFYGFIPSASRVPGSGSGQWGVLGDDPDDGDDEAEGVRYCFCLLKV